MNRSFRETLADSHVAAVAIAVLLLWTLNFGFQAVLRPLPNFIEFVAMAIAILGIPYHSFTGEDRILLLASTEYVFAAVMTFIAASILARWVYSTGPLSALSRCSDRLRRSNHA